LRFTAVLEKFYRGNNTIVMATVANENLTFVLAQGCWLDLVCEKDADGMMLLYCRESLL
jgi:hypothetical protein